MNLIGEAWIAIRGAVQNFDSDLRKGVEQPAKVTAKRVGEIIGGAFAVREIVQFGKRAFEAFSEAERAALSLANSFANSTSLAGANVAQYEAMAEALQDVTRFEDEATKSAIGVLAQFNLTEQQLQQLIPLVADYAAKTQQDIVSGAQSAGRALLGQGRALKSVGIDFQDTGSKVGNFEQLIDGLTQKVGGFAEKEGKQAGVQAIITANQFGELQETLGEVLAYGFGPVARGAQFTVKSLQALPGPLKFAATGVIAVAAVAGVGAIAVNTLSAAVTTLGLSMRTVAMSTGIGAALVVGLTVLGAIFASNAQKAAEHQEAVDKLSASLRSGKASVDDYRAEVSRLALIAGQTGGIVQDALIEQQERIGDAIKTTASDIRTAAEELPPYQQEMIEAALANENFKRASDLLAIAQERQAGTSREAAEAALFQAESARKARLELLGLAGGFLGVQASALSAKDASRTLAEARAEVEKLTEKGKQGTGQYRDAVSALQEAQVDAIESQLGLADSVVTYLQEMGAADKSQRKINELVREYGRMAGLSRSEISELRRTVAGLIEEYDKLPKSKRTEFDTPGLDEAVTKVTTLLDLIGRLPSRTAAALASLENLPASPRVTNRATADAGGSATFVTEVDGVRLAEVVTRRQGTIRVRVPGRRRG